MTPAEQANLETARRYLRSIEEQADGGLPFFTEDVIQEEFPNRFVPNGARRGLEELREAAERGKKAISAQRYEVLHAIASEDTVALEVQWTGILAVPLGSLPVGGEMRARFAVFLQLRDGKIAAQRNYDCFEPF